MSGKGPAAAEEWWRGCSRRGRALGGFGLPHRAAEPRHVDVTGDYAYVVAPATMTFDLRGQQVTQTGSVYTVALRRESWCRLATYGRA